MAIITLKNGLAANIPVLGTAEPGFTTDTQKLFIGDAGTNVLINPFTEAQAIDIANKVAALGTAANANTGTAPGDVPVVQPDGKLDPSLVPAQFVNNVYVVATVADLITLTNAQVGDIAIVTGTSETYALQTLPATTASNWVKLLFNNSVLSVNGKTGVVTLTGQDILIPSYTIGTSTTILPTDSVTQALGKLAYADTLLAPLASPALSGIPTAPTAALGTDTAQLATTAFVKAAIDDYSTSNPGNFVKTVNGISPVAGAVTVGGANINLTGYTTVSSYTAPTASMSINTAIANLAYGVENVDGGTF